jgi:hypothetical protein
MQHPGEISLDQQVAVGFVLAWLLIGFCLAIAIMRKDGVPDRESWDGPEIDWKETFSLIGACIAGGPLWIVLGIWMRRAG